MDNIARSARTWFAFMQSQIISTAVFRLFFNAACFALEISIEACFGWRSLNYKFNDICSFIC
jgi:hypothetical protein